MAAKTYNVNGRTCRFYRDGGIFVTSDGTYAAIKSKGSYLYLRTRMDDLGKFVVHPWYGNRISIAKAVLTCFCPPHPYDGKHYGVMYKDGNKSNCNYKNLEWVEYHHVSNPNDSYNYFCGNSVLTIKRDGTIYKGKRKETIETVIGDADTDSMVTLADPFIGVRRPGTIHQRHVPVDQLMDVAGFVNGDDAVLDDPVILHRDNDWMNFDSDNLEYVERTDERYIQYQQQKEKDIAANNAILNHKPMP